MNFIVRIYFLTKNFHEKNKMQLTLKTILNLKEKHANFVYRSIALNKKRIEVLVEPRKRSQAVCSGCGDRSAGYDKQPQREFMHVPIYGLEVIFIYSMRRVECKKCGIKVEQVPWCSGKSPITIAYSWFLSEWAKLLSIEEVAVQFKTTWHHVFSGVRMAVEWGRTRLDLTNITAIGVDEIYWARKKFMTVVYQIDNHCKRLIWCGEDRKEQTIRDFFDWFTDDRSQKLKFICSDMWKPYLKVIAEKATTALNILISDFDRL